MILFVFFQIAAFWLILLPPTSRCAQNDEGTALEIVAGFYEDCLLKRNAATSPEAVFLRAKTMLDDKIQGPLLAMTVLRDAKSTLKAAYDESGFSMTRWLRSTPPHRRFMEVVQRENFALLVEIVKQCSRSAQLASLLIDAQPYIFYYLRQTKESEGIAHLIVNCSPLAADETVRKLLYEFFASLPLHTFDRVPVEAPFDWSFFTGAKFAEFEERSVAAAVAFPTKFPLETHAEALFSVLQHAFRTQAVDEASFFQNSWNAAATSPWASALIEACDACDASSVSASNFVAKWLTSAATHIDDRTTIAIFAQFEAASKRSALKGSSVMILALIAAFPDPTWLWMQNLMGDARYSSKISFFLAVAFRWSTQAATMFSADVATEDSIQDFWEDDFELEASFVRFGAISAAYRRFYAPLLIMCFAFHVNNDQEATALCIVKHVENLAKFTPLEFLERLPAFAANGGFFMRRYAESALLIASNAEGRIALAEATLYAQLLLRHCSVNSHEEAMRFHASTREAFETAAAAADAAFVRSADEVDADGAVFACVMKTFQPAIAQSATFCAFHLADDAAATQIDAETLFDAVKRLATADSSSSAAVFSPAASNSIGCLRPSNVGIFVRMLWTHVPFDDASVMPAQTAARFMQILLCSMASMQPPLGRVLLRPYADAFDFVRGCGERVDAECAANLIDAFTKAFYGLRDASPTLLHFVRTFSLEAAFIDAVLTLPSAAAQFVACERFVLSRDPIPFQQRNVSEDDLWLQHVSFLQSFLASNGGAVVDVLNDAAVCAVHIQSLFEDAPFTAAFAASCSQFSFAQKRFLLLHRPSLALRISQTPNGDVLLASLAFECFLQPMTQNAPNGEAAAALEALCDAQLFSPDDAQNVASFLPLLPNVFLTQGSSGSSNGFAPVSAANRRRISDAVDAVLRDEVPLPDARHFGVLLVALSGVCHCALIEALQLWSDASSAASSRIAAVCAADGAFFVRLLCETLPLFVARRPELREFVFFYVGRLTHRMAMAAAAAAASSSRSWKIFGRGGAATPSAAQSVLPLLQKLCCEVGALNATEFAAMSSKIEGLHALFRSISQPASLLQRAFNSLPAVLNVASSPHARITAQFDALLAADRIEGRTLKRLFVMLAVESLLEASNVAFFATEDWKFLHANIATPRLLNDRVVNEFLVRHATRLQPLLVNAGALSIVRTLCAHFGALPSSPFVSLDCEWAAWLYAVRVLLPTLAAVPPDIFLVARLPIDDALAEDLFVRLATAVFGASHAESAPFGAQFAALAALAESHVFVCRGLLRVAAVTPFDWAAVAQLPAVATHIQRLFVAVAAAASSDDSINESFLRDVVTLHSARAICVLLQQAPDFMLGAAEKLGAVTATMPPDPSSGAIDERRRLLDAAFADALDVHFADGRRRIPSVAAVTAAASIDESEVGSRAFALQQAAATLAVTTEDELLNRVIATPATSAIHVPAAFKAFYLSFVYVSRRTPDAFFRLLCQLNARPDDASTVRFADFMLLAECNWAQSSTAAAVRRYHRTLSVGAGGRGGGAASAALQNTDALSVRSAVEAHIDELCSGLFLRSPAQNSSLSIHEQWFVRLHAEIHDAAACVDDSHFFSPAQYPALPPTVTQCALPAAAASGNHVISPLNMHAPLPPLPEPLGFGQATYVFSPNAPLLRAAASPVLTVTTVRQPPQLPARPTASSAAAPIPAVRRSLGLRMAPSPSAAAPIPTAGRRNATAAAAAAAIRRSFGAAQRQASALGVSDDATVNAPPPSHSSTSDNVAATAGSVNDDDDTLSDAQDVASPRLPPAAIRTHLRSAAASPSDTGFVWIPKFLSTQMPPPSSSGAPNAAASKPATPKGGGGSWFSRLFQDYEVGFFRLPAAFMNVLFGVWTAIAILLGRRTLLWIKGRWPLRRSRVYRHLIFATPPRNVTRDDPNSNVGDSSNSSINEAFPPPHLPPKKSHFLRAPVH